MLEVRSQKREVVFSSLSALQLECDSLLDAARAVAVVDPRPLDAGGARRAGHAEHARAQPGSLRGALDAQEPAEREVRLRETADRTNQFRPGRAPGAVDAIDADLGEHRGDRPAGERC